VTLSITGDVECQPVLILKAVVMNITPTGGFKKVAPHLKLLEIFSLRLSLFAWNFANLLAIHIHIYLTIFVDLYISSNGINFSMSIHRFHPVKFRVGLFTQKRLMHLFGNDVIFSLSRVLVSHNCKQSTTVRFLLLTFYWHRFKAW